MCVVHARKIPPVATFRILDSGKSKFDATIIEALHIKYNRPCLKQLFTQTSSFVCILLVYSKSNTLLKCSSLQIEIMLVTFEKELRQLEIYQVKSR